jgi:hypothetical protein
MLTQPLKNKRKRKRDRKGKNKEHIVELDREWMMRNLGY